MRFHNACILYHGAGDLSRGFLNFFEVFLRVFTENPWIVHIAHLGWELYGASGENDLTSGMGYDIIRIQTFTI